MNRAEHSTSFQISLCLLLSACLVLLAPRDATVYVLLGAYLLSLFLSRPRKAAEYASWSPWFWYNAVSLAMLASGGLFIRYLAQHVTYIWIDRTVWNSGAVAVNLVALVFFNTGLALGRRSVFYREAAAIPAWFVRGTVLVLAASLVANFYGFKVGGVPAFNPAIYKGSYWSPPMLLNVLLVLVYAVPIFSVVVGSSDTRRGVRQAVLLLSGFLLFALLLTNRNTILLGVMMIPALLQVRGLRVSTRALAIGALALFVVAMGYGIYRTAVQFEGSARDRYVEDRLVYAGFGNQYEKLRLDTMAADADVRARIQQGVPGRLVASGLFQFLPGKQESDDIILRRELYGAASVRSGLATPLRTVLLLEFGYVGIAIGMTVLGWFSSIAFNTLCRSRGPFELAANVYWLWLLIVKTIYANLFSRVDVFVVGLLLMLTAAIGHAPRHGPLPLGGRTQ